MRISPTSERSTAIAAGRGRRRLASVGRRLLAATLLVGWLAGATGDCPPIYVPLNGNLVGQFENQCKTTEGSVCRVNCNYSYKLVGDFERVCSSGQWSGYEAFCVGKCRVNRLADQLEQQMASKKVLRC